jgi:hypothetical protein
MERGNIFSGVHLSVPNAVGAGVRYAAEYDVASITSYVEHYAYSPEVVLGGSAAVYFDVFSATMSSCPEADHAIDVTATIETDGAPELLATPFFGGTPLRIPLTALGQDPDETVELLVANQGMDCETQENHFDFLLHYLTSRTGIPRRLTQPTPGMHQDQRSFSQLTRCCGTQSHHLQLSRGLRLAMPSCRRPSRSAPELSQGNGLFREGKRQVSDPHRLPACSNSQYP